MFPRPNTIQFVKLYFWKYSGDSDRKLAAPALIGVM